MAGQTSLKKPVLFSVLSGSLLFLSYPPYSLGFLAWIALLPLFWALGQAASRGQAFLFGYLSGLSFFMGGIHWLTNVTPIGCLLLIAFEALFAGLFGLLIYAVSKNTNFLFRMLWTGLAWTFSEFLRVKFPVLGFGWNLLGYSQADYGIVIQSANVFGAYGLGFVIAAVNACLHECFAKGQGEKGKSLSLRPMPFALCLTIFVLLFSHGFYHQRQSGKKIGDLRISVIQGNIPQSIKWEMMARDKIIEIYMVLTELAHFDRPSLIIWPEAAFPGYFNRDQDAKKVLDLIQKIEIPAIIGAPHLEDMSKDIAYNTAYLVGPDGQIKKRYDKQNLVPFGEYVPIPWALGWLAPYAYTMGVGNFTAGKEKTVFEILNQEFSFSVLICFEDVFPELSRQFVDAGAQFLTVITNDAWFGKTGAPAQHLQASIFRAVENGVPVVRAANTGISAFISNRGEVLGKVEDKNRKTIFIAGHKTLALPVENKPTLYRSFGWVFPYAACGVFVIMSLILFRSQKTENGRQKADA